MTNHGLFRILSLSFYGRNTSLFYISRYILIFVHLILYPHMHTALPDTIYAIQHLAFEDLGSLEDTFYQMGYRVRYF